METVAWLFGTATVTSPGCCRSLSLTSNHGPSRSIQRLDQDARRAEFTQTIRSVVEDTWQVPIVDWSQHTRVQMTAKELQDEVAVGSRRYEMVVMAQAGEPLELADGTEWARRFFPSREINRLLRERYNDYPELEQAYELQVIEAAKART